MITGKIYMLISFAFTMLALLLFIGTVALFSFKQKIHFIRKELRVMDMEILYEKRRTIMLESSFALESSSFRLKNLADKYLNAKFTNVSQLTNLKDLSSYNYDSNGGQVYGINY